MESRSLKKHEMAAFVFCSNSMNGKCQPPTANFANPVVVSFLLPPTTQYEWPDAISSFLECLSHSLSVWSESQYSLFVTRTPELLLHCISVFHKHISPKESQTNLAIFPDNHARPDFPATCFGLERFRQQRIAILVGSNSTTTEQNWQKISRRSIHRRHLLGCDGEWGEIINERLVIVCHDSVAEHHSNPV